jgi:electron transport complex protein RnfB
LLQRPVVPLNPAHGEHKPRHVAVIDEETCIGCARCIKACPVDAILGAFKLMHTVIADECTGCELCLPPCPVDCIVMQRAPLASAQEQHVHAARARTRHRARDARLARIEREDSERHRAKLTGSKSASASSAVQEAIARALARKKTQGPP